MNMPLVYSIDSWDKLPQCISNISERYHIYLEDIIGGTSISGRRLVVRHDRYGDVFSCLISASGSLLDNVNLMDKATILAELKRFGFSVRFNTETLKISDRQLRKLWAAYNMGAEYVRIISVPGLGVNSACAIAFKDVDVLGDWMNNWYSPDSEELSEALVNANAFVLYDVTKKNEAYEDWSDFKGAVYQLSTLLSKYNYRLNTIISRDVSKCNENGSRDKE